MKRILILAGLSAAGKTTVMIGSATTRSPRGDGRDSEYIYVTKEEFVSGIASGEMLEYTEFAGNLYGTPAFEIERILTEGKNPLLILDINGVISLKKSRYSNNAFAVWLWDEPKVLESRLRERISLADSVEQGEKIFESRMSENKSDAERIKTLDGIFDITIKNESISDTVKTIKKSLCR